MRTSDVTIYLSDDPYDQWEFDAVSTEHVSDSFEAPKYAVPSREFGARRSVLNETTIEFSGVLTDSQWAGTDSSVLDRVAALRRAASESRAFVVDAKFSDGQTWFVTSVDAESNSDNRGIAISLSLTRALDAHVQWGIAQFKRARPRPKRNVKVKTGGRPLTEKERETLGKKNNVWRDLLGNTMQ